MKAVRDLDTKKEVLTAIRKATYVMICVRFGVAETEVRILKPEAINFVNRTLDDETTPDNMEMYFSRFGAIYDDGSVTLG